MANTGAQTAALIVVAEDGVAAYQVEVQGKPVSPKCRECYRDRETVGHKRDSDREVCMQQENEQLRVNTLVIANHTPFNRPHPPPPKRLSTDYCNNSSIDVYYNYM